MSTKLSDRHPRLVSRIELALHHGVVSRKVAGEHRATSRKVWVRHISVSREVSRVARVNRVARVSAAPMAEEFRASLSAIRRPCRWSTHATI